MSLPNNDCNPSGIVTISLARIRIGTPNPPPPPSPGGPCGPRGPCWPAKTTSTSPDARSISDTAGPSGFTVTDDSATTAVISGSFFVTVTVFVLSTGRSMIMTLVISRLRPGHTRVDHDVPLVDPVHH